MQDTVASIRRACPRVAFSNIPVPFCFPPSSERKPQSSSRTEKSIFIKLSRILLPVPLTNASKPDVREASQMVIYLLLLPLLIGFPMPAVAQFIDKGDRVEVAKGTKLCSSQKLEKERMSQEPGRVFWRVTSKMRSNGTQTVVAYVHETVYETKSGDTTIKENLYQEDYATFFKRDQEHKGMLLMISPQDGKIEATVEVCEKKK
jgi:hypothetical protein